VAWVDNAEQWQSVTQTVNRHQLRPVIETGATTHEGPTVGEPIDRVAPRR
jgi:hypothetical protein